MRAIYMAIHVVVFTALGHRVAGRSRSSVAREVVDKAFDQPSRIDLRYGAARMAVLVGVVIGGPIMLLALLLYPLYEAPVIMVAGVASSLVFYAFSLSQVPRMVASAWSHRRWTSAGRPSDWTASWLTRPHPLDLALWLVIAIVLIRQIL
ncbi:hypothetical protein N866_12465 [Actinotalea ferrariae CF5-4]|uniref:Uncharacterized protein n=1 Tax=Actinotalea ferrariae CF5-4 TaxID=948458 RepID=A0A021VSK2_9CELL|nr:hypothetical protein [Actinotalea ferrariae]EYR62037.1 hypothetical protein N866_12465 [Actinotalea ferrariae CF5-4]